MKCHISEVLVMPQDDKNLTLSEWKFRGKLLLFRLLLEIRHFLQCNFSVL